MIRLADADLPLFAAQKLAAYQAALDALPDYEAQVKAAEAQWKKRNKAGNPTFRSVRKTLETLCCGQRRCGYCENSAADEIDHVRPKSFCPDTTFAWENYVYVCGLCNGAKLNQFGVFAAASGDFTELERGRGVVPYAPPLGNDVFIHPRRENPLDFFTLDLRDTFEFFPVCDEDENPIVWRRAEFTLRVLKLNAPDYLPKARRNAYGEFRSRLREYLDERDKGAMPSDLVPFMEAFGCCNHQAVWQEMKTQHLKIPELAALFEAAPEALTW